MTDTRLRHFHKKITKTKHKYCGKIDENGFRNGTGCQQWKNEIFFQKYTGNFLYNNLHFKGHYLVDQKGHQLYFNGFFYANKLEGYGQVVYSDGKVFEGLFKEHLRFGPGVVTYPNDTQDVGFWDGFSLMKLSQTVGADFVPKLGVTPQGSARLLKFRALVPVEPKNVDVAKELLKTLDVSEDILAQSDLLYNLDVRNPESLLFNTKLYNQNFVEEDCSIEIELSEEEFQQELMNLLCSEDSSPNIDLEAQIKPNCRCFDETKTKFEQLCKELKEVEDKLGKITSRRNDLEEKLARCRICCANNCPLSINKSYEYSISRDSDTLINIFSKRTSSSHLQLSENVIRLFDYGSFEEKIVTSETSVPKALLPGQNLSANTLPFDVDNEGSKSNQYSIIILPPRDQTTISHEHQISNRFLSDHSEEIEALNQDRKKICECDKFKIGNIKTMLEKLEELTQDQVFFGTVRKCIKYKLDVEYCKMQKLPKAQTRFTKKINITDLLAWNNSNFWKKMLQHCFRHRKSEENVCFNVVDLLAGRRNTFNKPGAYEISCIKYLQECLDGAHKNAFVLLRTFEIHPDLCDSRGNTGLMLAASNDKVDVIDMLIKCGANIDIFNDEGLTPLLMCLLRYLALYLKVSDWEKGFLQEPRFSKEDLLHIKNWRMKSFSDVKVRSDDCLEKLQRDDKIINDDDDATEEEEDDGDTNYEDFESEVTTTANHQVQTFVLSTEFIYPPKPKKDKKKKKKHKKKKTRKKKSKGSKKKKKKNKKKSKRDKVVEDELPPENVIDKEQLLIDNKLYNIRNTITKILSFGSDPNIGEVPMKSLHLAVFSDCSELFLELLENGADPNMQTLDENLTCLHILSSIIPTDEKVRMCKMLVNFDADLNLKTSVYHWPELKREIVGRDVDISNITDHGKSVLHVLSLRQDFLSENYSKFLTDLAETFVFNGCNPDDLYLGHSALSLAVLRGNLKLIDTLLDTKCVNPYHILGSAMGNALTVLVLKRFDTLLPHLKLEIVDVFVKHRFNPLHRVGDFENVLHFIENEAEADAKKIHAKKSKKHKKGKKKNKKHKKKKKGKKHKSNLPSVEDYLKEVTKKILFRNVQARAIENLYVLITENLFSDSLIRHWAKSVIPEEVVDYLKLLFQYGVIEKERFSYSVIYDLIEFIKLQHFPEKLESNAEKEELDNKLKNTEFLDLKKEASTCKVYLPLPEVDRDEAKYKVCFQCLRGVGKNLQKCPRCELVYFCSESCNLLNNKACKLHKCNLVFYDKIRESNKTKKLFELASLLQKERNFSFQLRILDEKLSAMKFQPNLMLKKRDKLETCLENLTKQKRVYVKSNNLKINSFVRSESLFLENPESRDKILEDLDNNHESLVESIFIPRSRDIVSFPEQEVSVGKSLKTAEICSSQKTQNRRILKSLASSKKKKTNRIVSTFEIVPEINNISDEIILNNITNRRPLTKEYYLELLSKIFADFNLPLILLPYACFKDGQVYYSMSDNAYLGKNFQKLVIPN